ncbi:MAG: hypothetical protein SV760_06495, partial [Halobacteria archaeon]|nr:hypothetical protein [Halobacteria archaeon]
YDPEGVRELADEITEPRSIERLLRREENAEDRQEVKRSLRERLDETEEAITDDGNSSRGDGSEPNRSTRSDTYDTFDERVDSLLASLLETRIRARVYAGALSLDGATPEEVSEETGLAPETVESSLEEMELEGIAESDGEEYDVVPPHQVVRTVSDDLSDFLRSFDLRD